MGVEGFDVLALDSVQFDIGACLLGTYIVQVFLLGAAFILLI